MLLAQKERRGISLWFPIYTALSCLMLNTVYHGPVKSLMLNTPLLVILAIIWVGVAAMLLDSFPPCNLWE